MIAAFRSRFLETKGNRGFPVISPPRTVYCRLAPFAKSGHFLVVVQFECR